ncbi:DMT family transporter [Acididesulfobacillus acetoxydans]|uniref:DMT family transporter n=1 Tax=Acididesulfobacillus acetoxydans TaxID=1561005 RepID=UPI001F0DBE52|nr:DMT family transporter [Acididesulfobacillus acetoxydans]
MSLDKANPTALPTKMGRPKAILFLVITATLWSSGGLLIKSVHANPLAIAGVRSAIAAVLMLLVLGKPKITGSWAQIGGSVSYAATVILFVAATKYTTAANAILLQYTAPIYIAFLGTWLLHEKTKPSDWLTIIIVIIGMVLFFLDHLSTKGIFGNTLGVLSGISFAFLHIFMRMQKDGSPWESAFLGNILTAVVGLPFLFQSWPNATGWFYLSILGTVQLGVSYILYAKAIKHATALEAVLILILEPILNPVWVFLFLGEAPGPWALVGGIIVLAAITLRNVLAALPTLSSSPSPTSKGG